MVWVMAVHESVMCDIQWPSCSLYTILEFFVPFWFLVRRCFLFFFVACGMRTYWMRKRMRTECWKGVVWRPPRVARGRAVVPSFVRGGGLLLRTGSRPDQGQQFLGWRAAMGRVRGPLSM